jgi:E3 ubiquitin-protein ligase RFWD2
VSGNDSFFTFKSFFLDSEELLPTGGLGPKLEEFSGIMSGMSKFAKFQRLATLNYNVESLPNSSNVSSNEFDRDGEFFVVAGVTKKIKLHDFNAVAYGGDNGIHYPLHQLQCTSKIR